MIFDGHCGFCRIWVDYGKQLTSDSVDYAPSQEVGDEFPQIPREAFSKSVQLVHMDGSVTSGAQAVFEAIGREGWYESSPMLASASEAAYRFIAAHRNLFYWVTRLTFGKRIEPARFVATQALFLRALAIIYAVAFGSLATQIVGLVGARGISPVHDYLARLAGSFGPMRFAAIPTLFWFNSSDAVLTAAAWAGVALAALVFSGVLKQSFLARLAIAGLYFLYLSLDLAGQAFLSFQWDSLLLETGFLAIFFGRSVSGTRTIAWLYRWLMFRLYFLSGYVKLASHDPTWRNLTALKYHYHTQPIPNVISWYADKLPDWFQRASTAGTLGIELGAAFLIFCPRMWRLTGAWLILGLQTLIFFTGNFAFFNPLTAAIALFLFDDQALRAIAAKLRVRAPALKLSTVRSRMGAALLTLLILSLGFIHLADNVAGGVPEPVELLSQVASPFQIVNGYGLFATMTTSRPEIMIQGSNDGEHWTPYEFRYKAGPLNRAPRWIEPFQPRLDWQMWFAALGNYQENPWFTGLILRLLDGSPAVLGLLESNPFPGNPPRYIRAQVFEYSFSDSSMRQQTGEWWRRQPLGEYLPPVGLKQP